MAQVALRAKTRWQGTLAAPSPRAATLIDGGLGVRVAQAVGLSNPCLMEFVGLTSYAESGSPDELLDSPTIQFVAA